MPHLRKFVFGVREDAEIFVQLLNAVRTHDELSDITSDVSDVFEKKNKEEPHELNIISIVENINRSRIPQKRTMPRKLQRWMPSCRLCPEHRSRVHKTTSLMYPSLSVICIITVLSLSLWISPRDEFPNAIRANGGRRRM